MPNRQVVLLDKENQESGLYYLPILHRIDCISPKSRLNNGRTKFIGAPVLDKTKINGRHIFWPEKLNSDLPIISLDLAESILRRDGMGISLEPVELG